MAWVGGYGSSVEKGCLFPYCQSIIGVKVKEKKDI